MFSRAAADVTPQRYPHDRLAAVIPVDTARYSGTEFARQRFWRRCPDDWAPPSTPVQRAASIPDGFGKAIEGKQTLRRADSSEPSTMSRPGSWAREPCRHCSSNRPYAHAFLCPAQWCHGAAASRTPLLCRRIERAQEMLVGTVVSLVDAALSVEFQTQAHFPNRVQTLLGPTAGW